MATAAGFEPGDLRIVAAPRSFAALELEHIDKFIFLDKARCERCADEVVSEVCRWRLVECATHLAQWRYDDPSSQRLAAQLALQRDARPARAELDPERIESLVELFSDLGPAGPQRLERATSLTELFAAAYTHAAPFAPDVVQRIWERCEGDADRCAKGRAEALARVGGGG